MTPLKSLPVAVLLLSAGCATVPYHYGTDAEYIHGPRLAAGEPQISFGRPNKVLDASDWIWPGSLLAKIILWNHKMDSHEISTQTVEAVQIFLEDNDLRDVKVRINEYSVGAELKRTVRNTSIGAGWRYTVGIIGWLGYTILPGRIFGGDNYNPYSNTINLYSDLPPVGLHEAGHSKDFAQRTYKGTYGVVYSVVPLFNLYPEYIASSEALSYLQAKGDRTELQNAYKLLYPAYGTYLGGAFADVVVAPWIYAVEAGIIIPAHIVGRNKAAHVPEHLPRQPPAKGGT